MQKMHIANADLLLALYILRSGSTRLTIIGGNPFQLPII